MAELSPFAAAALVAPVDPHEMLLHLEVCRMQAELQVVRGRIADLRGVVESHRRGSSLLQASAANDDIVDRMVTSLLEAGRRELKADERRCRHDAESRIGEARRRSDQIVETARAELEAALDERTASIDVTRAGELDGLLCEASRRISRPPSEVARALAAPASPTLTVVPPSEGLPTPVTVPGAAERLGPPVDGFPSAARRQASEQEAFEAWMAVAPAFTTWDGEGGDQATSKILRRSLWRLPQEVALVLVAVALVVIAALVVLG